MKRVLPLIYRLNVVCIAVICTFPNLHAKHLENLRFESCPSDIQVSPIPGLDVGIAQWTPPTVMGGLGIVTVTKTHRPGAFFPLGNTVVTYTAKDLAGNQATCSFQVIVANDSTPVEPRTKDSLALVDLYRNTNGEFWWNSWDLEQPMETWFGITINQENRVYLLTLEENNLTGILPNSIGDLNQLEWLDLRKNNISGSLPERITELSKLEILLLKKNNLTGSIPTSIGNLEKLKWLVLDENELSGEIPKSIGQLTRLENLGLSENNLRGNIELAWDNLEALQTINLSFNQLSGSIPSNISQLRNLGFLRFSSNKFTGNLPENIGELKSLWNLNLSGNQLSGALPASIGQLERLSHMTLQSNQFSGVIPQSIGNLRLLSSVTLQNNQFSGTIPKSISNLRALVVLDLSSNQLSGEIPDLFSNLRNLRDLALSNNELAGIIPKSIYTNLPFLERLYLSGNQLTGGIDPAITRLQRLRELHFQANQLEGNIPENIGALSNIKVILLGYNQLTGSIPGSFARLANLTQLDLSNNELSGCYPDELQALCSVPNIYFGHNEYLPNQGDFRLFCANGSGACSNGDNSCRSVDSLTLVALHNRTGGLAWNDTWNLESSLDTWHGVTLNQDGCVVELDLSSNNLSFRLPEEIADLHALEVLNLSDNLLEGDIPSSIKNEMERLRVLNLSRNYFSTFGLFNFTNFDNLEVLDLSDNQLQSNLPDKLDDIPNLRRLYLQNNNFSGCFQEKWKAALCGLGFAATKEEDGYNFTNNPDLPENGDFQAFCEGTLGACENNKNSRNQDSLALVAFYNALDGPNWSNSWNLSEPLENWEGLSFFNVNGVKRVARIFLINNDLKGEIPNAIGQLTYLESLVLNGNQIRGTIPSSISKNRRLFSISLSFNEITAIPSKISSLQRLRFLEVHYNQITTIPSSIGRIRTLFRLNLSSNNITVIPEVLGTMNRLHTLDLGFNEINTPFPRFLLQLQSLVELKLGNCGLVGGIPIDIDRLSSLKELNLLGNNFTGGIPSGILQLENLEILTLSKNQLTGSIPENISDLKNLRDLFLTSNQLSGPIPNSITTMKSLLLLHLGNNRLTGNIPKDIGNLTNIYSIDLSNNLLSGCFPESMTTFCGADIDFNFDDNPDLPSEGYFVPFCREGLFSCECTRRDTFILANFYENNGGENWTNRWELSKPVSEWYGVTASDEGCVEKLNLRNNNLSGSLHYHIFELADMVELDLGENMLEGTRSVGNVQTPSNLEVLKLDNNQIEGRLDYYLPMLEKLEFIDLSNNQFEGCFPETYTAYCDNDGVEVDFSNNNLIIPFETYCEEGEDACSGAPAQANIAPEKIVIAQSNEVFNIAPNPSSGHLHINFNLAEPSILSILSAQGKVIETTKLEKGQFSMRRNWEYLPDGMYYVQIKTQNQVFSKKVSLMR
ncbi:MAG: HYR domain-containing protein [Bacteroidota bacterium]